MPYQLSGLIDGRLWVPPPIYAVPKAFCRRLLSFRHLGHAVRRVEAGSDRVRACKGPGQISDRALMAMRCSHAIGADDLDITGRVLPCIEA